MDKKILLILLILQINLLFSQGSSFAPPPGTIKLNDSLYIDKAPVSNLMIAEMEDYFEKGKDTMPGFPSFPFDPDDIDLGTSYSSFFASLEDPAWKHYNRYANFSNHPALYLTREQAELYCRWRTGMVNRMLWIKSVNPEEKGKFPTEVLYRLPTQEEYQQAVNFFEGKGRLKYTKEESPLDLKPKWKLPNRFFIYNVSEYTAEDGVTGSNWKEESPSGSPNDYTGFRCICEIREN